MEASSHERDLVSLFFGVVSIALGGLFLLSAGGAVSIDGRWALPAAIITVGAAGLLAALRQRSDPSV